MKTFLILGYLASLYTYTHLSEPATKQNEARTGKTKVREEAPQPKDTNFVNLKMRSNETNFTLLINHPNF
ncbi:MAG: hypothetical protein KDC80_07015 [Saprospiraceae bacterium]|nr:hypothetical protein [Saprospiraceae bacterium]